MGRMLASCPRLVEELAVQPARREAVSRGRQGLPSSRECSRLLTWFQECRCKGVLWRRNA